MKLRYVVMVGVFIILIVHFIVSPKTPNTDQQHPKLNQEIKVFKLQEDLQRGKLLFTFKNKKTVDLFVNILHESEQMSGILNVVNPNYIVDYYEGDQETKSIFLWISKEHEDGMFEYTNKTEVGYVISGKQIKELKKLLNLIN